MKRLVILILVFFVILNFSVCNAYGCFNYTTGTGNDNHTPIFDQPLGKGRLIAWIPNNTALRCSAHNGIWVKVIYWLGERGKSDCIIGWIPKDFLKCLSK